MSDDIRDVYIARVVNGCSFVDIGGLWGTINEKVSVAHQHGASSLTMMDVTVEGGELWDLFRERMKSLNIEDFECESGDVCAVDGRQSYDVVHSSGVLYHHPNPFDILRAYRRLTKQYLIISSAVIPTTISNEFGSIQLPASGLLFVPALNEVERQIMIQFWSEGGDIAFGKFWEYNLDDFGPWFFLPTVTTLTKMCEIAGFRTIEGGHAGHGYTLLLEAK